MKFKVEFARVVYSTVTVEAEDEDSALDAARDELPEFSAQESGWGRDGYSADADDWLPLEEFYSVWGGEPPGPTVYEAEAD